MILIDSFDNCNRYQPVGLPVVAVDASGMRYIVQNGKQRFLVENDPTALRMRSVNYLGRNLYLRVFGPPHKKGQSLRDEDFDRMIRD